MFPTTVAIGVERSIGGVTLLMLPLLKILFMQALRNR
jgi:hypothetical protein